MKWTYSEESDVNRVLILAATTQCYLYNAPIHAINDIRRPLSIAMISQDIVEVETATALL